MPDKQWVYNLLCVIVELREFGNLAPDVFCNIHTAILKLAKRANMAFITFNQFAISGIELQNNKYIILLKKYKTIDNLKYFLKTNIMSILKIPINAPKEKKKYPPNNLDIGKCKANETIYILKKTKIEYFLSLFTIKLIIGVVKTITIKSLKYHNGKLIGSYLSRVPLIG